MNGRGTLLLQAGGSALMARHDNGDSLPSSFSLFSLSFYLQTPVVPVKCSMT